MSLTNVGKLVDEINVKAQKVLLDTARSNEWSGLFVALSAYEINKGRACLGRLLYPNVLNSVLYVDFSHYNPEKVKMFV